MRLEHVCDLELGYQGEFHLVKPYGGEEGSGYGQGDGQATGDKLAGTVRWANHPRRRSDGRMLPNGGGVIETGDGVEIPFVFQGRTVFRETSTGERRGTQLLLFTFDAQDERLRWLNDTLCVGEGLIDPATGRSHFRVYACVNELLGEVDAGPAV